MTIEESIKKDSSKFEAILETKSPDMKAAMDELSAKLDSIIGSAIKEYCEAENVEFDVKSVPEYKTMNKYITGKLDKLIGEQIKEKRKDL